MARTWQNIVVARHPQKDPHGADEITGFGAMQAWAAAENLRTKRRLAKVGRLIYSGANRTWQASRVMAAALWLSLVPEENEAFHFKKLFDQIFGEKGGEEAFWEDFRRVKEAGGTVGAALEISAYARLGRQQVERAILQLASDMAGKEQRIALVLSHSPLLELAVPSAFQGVIPYQIAETDAVIYRVADQEIVFAELVRAPEMKLL